MTLNNELIRGASDLSRFIRGNVTNSAGLFRTETFIVDEKRWHTDLCDPDDFGDFAPFMAWLDYLTSGSNNKDWVDRQYILIKQKLKQDSGLYGAVTAAFIPYPICLFFINFMVKRILGGNE